jgi:hypothetical protein
MGRRKGQAPVWVQVLIVWIVISGLGAAGVMFLRSREVFSDAIFQPLVPVLCQGGDRIETRYSSRMNLVDDRGRSSTTGANRQQVSTGLDAATCVSADGRQAEAAGFTPLVLGIAGIAGAVFVGLVALTRR